MLSLPLYVDSVEYDLPEGTVTSWLGLMSPINEFMPVWGKSCFPLNWLPQPFVTTSPFIYLLIATYAEKLTECTMNVNIYLYFLFIVYLYVHVWYVYTSCLLVKQHDFKFCAYVLRSCVCVWES